MADYGEYNKEITKKKKDTFDTKNSSSTNAIKRVIVKNFSESQIKEGPYIGYVLRVDEGEGFASFMKSIFSPQWVAKVRIPELDAHIPEPSDFPNPTDEKEIQKIEMHPTYFPKSSKGVDKPKAGAKVLVERDSNGENNFIIEILDKEGVSEKPTQTGDAKKAHTGEQKGETFNMTGGGSGTPRQGSPRAGRRNSYNEDGLTGFKRWNRGVKPTVFVIHETGGFGRKNAESAMKSKGGGVHFGADVEEIIQWEDPLWGLNHCPSFNKIAIGVEMIHGVRKSERWKARWFPGGWYSSPPLEQVERLYGLVHYVCENYGIELNFKMVQDGKFRFLGGINKGETSGIVSHVSGKGNHGDGSYPCLYMVHRINGHDPEDAYAITEDLARNHTPNLYAKHLITQGNGDPSPTLPLNMRQVLPLTYAERRDFPNYV